MILNLNNDPIGTNIISGVSYRHSINLPAEIKMKISHSLHLVLIGYLLLNPFAVMALHHEVEKSPETTTSDRLPNNEGKVVSFIDTTGYTYMELENGGKVFWIAAPTTKVNKGDHIRFVESMAMHNFTSKTLNRTFDRVIFVSSTMIKK